MLLYKNLMVLILVCQCWWCDVGFSKSETYSRTRCSRSSSSRGNLPGSCLAKYPKSGILFFGFWSWIRLVFIWCRCSQNVSSAFNAANASTHLVRSQCRTSTDEVLDCQLCRTSNGVNSYSSIKLVRCSMNLGSWVHGVFTICCCPWLSLLILTILSLPCGPTSDCIMISNLALYLSDMVWYSMPLLSLWSAANESNFVSLAWQSLSSTSLTWFVGMVSGDASQSYPSGSPIVTVTWTTSCCRTKSVSMMICL